jgi:hypothetical protein
MCICCDELHMHGERYNMSELELVFIFQDAVDLKVSFIKALQSWTHKSYEYKSFVNIYNKSPCSLHKSFNSNPSSIIVIDPELLHRRKDDTAFYIREICSLSVANKTVVSTKLCNSVNTSLHAVTGRAICSAVHSTDISCF